MGNKRNEKNNNHWHCCVAKLRTFWPSIHTFFSYCSNRAAFRFSFHLVLSAHKFNTVAITLFVVLFSHIYLSNFINACSGFDMWMSLLAFNEESRNNVHMWMRWMLLSGILLYVTRLERAGAFNRRMKWTKEGMERNERANDMRRESKRWDTCTELKRKTGSSRERSIEAKGVRQLSKWSHNKPTSTKNNHITNETFMFLVFDIETLHLFSFQFRAHRDCRKHTHTHSPFPRLLNFRLSLNVMPFDSIVFFVWIHITAKHFVLFSSHTRAYTQIPLASVCACVFCVSLVKI